MKKLMTTASVLACLAATTSVQVTKAADWPMFGRNLDNTADGKGETVISTKNVSTLKPKWVATTGGSVSARAALVDGIVYFPDWGGNLWALNAATGKVVWQHRMSDYGLPAKTVARDTPAIVSGVLYIGSQTGANLLAIDAATGALKWMTEIDAHPLAIVTGSPAVYGGMVFVGVSSNEEGAAATAGYKCCSFNGSVVAVNARTGKMLWKTMTSPAGYTGAAVWGSNPVVDTGRKAVYIGTGDNYSAPTDPAYQTCITNGGTELKCLSRNDHVDSMLSLDMATGKVKWARRMTSGDDWNVACAEGGPGAGNCPKNPGLDYDFGAGPNRFTITPPGWSSPMTVIGAGQKSGIYSAFNADTGALVWSTRVGPGSFLGGMEWGSATDGRRIYVALSNYDRKKYKSGTAGSWSALDPVTGDVLWQVPDPSGSIDLGPMAVANGIVYAGSMAGGAGQLNMFALDGATGKVLWSYASGGSVISGAAIADGVVYWGSGYANFGAPYTGNDKFYAFSINGK